MIVMQDEDNYITFRMEYNESSSAQRPGANFFLSQESNGTHSQLVASKDLADLVTDNIMYLKLSKRGNTYTGAISVTARPIMIWGLRPLGTIPIQRLACWPPMALWTATI